MRSNLIHEEYSSDKQYKFQVYQEEKYYEVFLQKRITDEYMGPDWFTYSDVRDYKHIADSFDNAMKIGMELEYNEWNLRRTDVTSVGVYTI